MKLYLMRHAQTDEGPQDDPDRELNDAGREECKIMRAWFPLAHIRPDRIICSDYARAHQTALQVRSEGTRIVTSQMLHPDSTVERAWQAIRFMSAGAKDVLVITHSPLIEPLLASVAFQFAQRFHWPHAAVAFVNPDEGTFHWFVTAKLAKHLVHSETKESALGFARDCIGLAENLIVAHKAAVVNPLVDNMKRALTARWKRQSIRIQKALPDLKPAIAAGDVQHVTAMLQAALPLADPKFTKAYTAARNAAYDAGAQHVHAQLGSPLHEAKKKPVPKVNRTPRDEDDPEDYEAGLDSTTNDRMQSTLGGLKAFEYAGVAAALRGMFKDFSQPPTGEVSRADTAALNVVSSAYHDGGTDLASTVADTTGAEVEKHWDAEDDACEVCLENESEDWIPEEAPHSSGDDEPPGHPNCRCSESYRIAQP